jgi:hypothetical protein
MPGLGGMERGGRTEVGGREEGREFEREVGREVV